MSDADRTIQFEGYTYQRHEPDGDRCEDGVDLLLWQFFSRYFREYETVEEAIAANEWAEEPCEDCFFGDWAGQVVLDRSGNVLHQFR